MSMTAAYHDPRTGSCRAMRPAGDYVEARDHRKDAVMKRPIIHADGKWYIGWDETVQTALGL